MDEVIIKQRRTPAHAPLSFSCGGCGVTLQMRRDAQTTSGPCPACGTIIECCPIMETAVEERMTVNAEEMVAPIPIKGSFKARQRIERPKEMDDSWKTRYAKDMEKFQKRKKVERLFRDFWESPVTSKVRKLALVALVLVLVGTVAFVFYDRKEMAKQKRAALSEQDRSESQAVGATASERQLPSN